MMLKLHNHFHTLALALLVSLLLVLLATQPVSAASAGGFLKIDGLPVDVNVYGDRGQSYRVEQWVERKVVRSVGNVQQGEPEFRVRPWTDNMTPWSCTP